MLVCSSTVVKARKIARELFDNGRTTRTVRDALDFVVYLPKDTLAATDCLFVSFILSQLYGMTRRSRAARVIWELPASRKYPATRPINHQAEQAICLYSKSAYHCFYLSSRKIYEYLQAAEASPESSLLWNLVQFSAAHRCEVLYRTNIP